MLVPYILHLALPLLVPSRSLLPIMYTPTSDSSLHTTGTRRSMPFAQEPKVLSLRCD
jgi:hypothetical protein